MGFSLINQPATIGGLPIHGHPYLDHFDPSAERRLLRAPNMTVKMSIAFLQCFLANISEPLGPLGLRKGHRCI